MDDDRIHDVTQVRYMDAYRVHVTFDDGTSGVVDFEKWWGPFPGILSEVKPLEVFKQVFIEPETKTLVWPTPNKLDADPVIVYCMANNLPIPGEES